MKLGDIVTIPLWKEIEAGAHFGIIIEASQTLHGEWGILKVMIASGRVLICGTQDAEVISENRTRD